MTKKIMLFIFVYILISNVAAIEITRTYTISKPTLELHNTYTRILAENCQLAGKAGEPALPEFSATLLLPVNEEAVSIEITPEELTLLSDNVAVEPIQRLYPLSYEGIKSCTAGNQRIYNSDKSFTGNERTNLQTQFYRGFPIAFASISPFVYYPQSSDLYYYKSITIKIITEHSPKAMAALELSRNDEETISRLSAYVQNKQAVPAAIETRDRNNDYDLLIITIDEFEAYLHDFIVLKNSRGFRTKTITVEEIVDSFNGEDIQEKIRNCIINEYQEYNISYLLLAGDDENIPHRGFYDDAGGWEEDFDIPADIYYSNLDGSWNDNNNSYWGEPSEDDLIGEIAVGRLACDSQEEFENFIHKIYSYQQNPVTTDIKTSMMVGEDLGWEIWGKDNKEEIHLGSDSWGYETTGIPNSYEVTTLYDYDSVWDPFSDLLYELNQGNHLINHLGHCNTGYALKLDNDDISLNSCTNDGIEQGYYIVYSQGCYCGAFDNRTTSGSYIEDSITEKWSTLATGPVAMITNSRYGWGSYDTTNGSSQYFDRQFFDAIFGENIYLTGDAQKDAKEDNIPFIDHEANRWCFYCSNLFGDPTMDIWTDIPEHVTLNHSGGFIIGQDQYQVTVVSDSGFPIENAKISLMLDGECVGVGTTNSSGSTNIHTMVDITEPGSLLLCVSGHNLHYSEETVDIIPPTGPYLLVSGFDILAGDDDYIESGEHVTLDLDIFNIGINSAEDVTLNLTCDDEFLTLDDAVETIGSLAAGETTTCIEAFSFDISNLSPDNHPLNFVINMTSGDNTWSSTLNFIAFEPNCFAVTPTSFQIEMGQNETLQDTLVLSNTTDRIVDYVIRTEEVTRNVEGSYITCSTENFTPGETVNWIFTAYNLSPDNEWVSDINITFPAGVTVNEASNFIGGSGGALVWNQTTGEAVTVNWHGTTAIGYGYLHQNQAALAEINVTTDVNFAGNITIDYEFIGDGYGEDPHSTTGSLTLDYPLNWISLASSSGSLSGQENYSIPVLFDSEEMESGWYNCKIIINDGSRDVKEVPVSLHITNTATNDLIPQNTTTIINNYPNPFNPETTILLSIGADFELDPVVNIYNIRGQKIRSIPVNISNLNSQGLYQVNWNGTDDSGEKIGSGIYLYRIEGINSSVRKMILMK